MFPTLLVLFGRIKIAGLSKTDTHKEYDTNSKENRAVRALKSIPRFLFMKSQAVKSNPHSSPFYHGIWIVGILVFSLFAMIVNCYSLIKCDILSLC